MLILAKGYPNQFRNAKDELAASDAKQWFPSIDDFRATAVMSGGSSGEALTLAQVVEIIGKEKPGSIAALGLIGHANRSVFALAGRIVGDNIHFAQDSLIFEDTIKANLSKIKAVKDRFTEDGSITLYACDAGSGQNLLDAISDAFEVKVFGFQTEIYWCFTVSAKGKVTRGRTYFDSQGFEVHPDCDSNSFSSDIRAWGPNMSSKSGVHSKP